MKKPTTLNQKYLFIKQKHSGVEKVIIVEAEVSDHIKSREDFLDNLITGVSQWAEKTQEGAKCLYYAGFCLNIENLASYDLEEIVKFCHDIYEMNIELYDSDDIIPYDQELRS